MSIISDSYLIVRARGMSTPDGFAAPDVPGTWEVFYHDAGWSELRRPGGGVFHALFVAAHPTDALLGCWLVAQRSPNGHALLDELAAAPGNTFAEPARDVWLAALAGPGDARQIARRWADWYVTGFVAVDGAPVAINGPVRVFPRAGGVLPATVFDGSSGPWHFNGAGVGVPHLDASEVLHVTTWNRPAMMQTIAGYDDDASVEGP